MLFLFYRYFDIVLKDSTLKLTMLKLCPSANATSCFRTLYVIQTGDDLKSLAIKPLANSGNLPTRANQGNSPTSME